MEVYSSKNKVNKVDIINTPHLRSIKINSWSQSKMAKSIYLV